MIAKNNDNSDDNDDWQPLPISSSPYTSSAFCSNNGNTLSMFNKIQLKFTNADIDRNLQTLFDNPMYHNDDDLDEQDRPTETSKHESLYNPLQDDDNEQWLNSINTKHSNNNSINNNNNGNAPTRQKPLTCPSCFNQVAFSYKIMKNMNMNSSQNKIPHYLVAQPCGIVVLQSKIMRNRQAAQATVSFNQINNRQNKKKHTNMHQQYQQQSQQEQEQEVDGDNNYGKLLMQRQQQINVKIVCACECGADIGYYDVNKASYVLINVI